MESTPQEEAEGQAIVQVLAVVLERLVSSNSHLAASQQEETKFHALRAPAIGILQYLERIHKYASCSKECFILALIYIDRLIQRNNFLLTDLNVHRVVITAVLLAAKFFDDAYYNNAYYAKVGGVLVSEMNTLEVEFLFKIDFSLRVIPEVFDKYYAELIGHSSSGGMERIERCTDEELFRAQAVATTLPVPQAQAPLLQTYQQVAELNPLPVAYPNLTPAAPLEGIGNHYPIQALEHSVTAPAAPHQVQVTLEQNQMTAAAALEPVFPFPTLAHQVSVPQQAQAPPTQNPSELHLIYHQCNAGAAAVTATHTPVSAALQDMPLSHFNSNQALHHAVAAAAAAPQVQAYPQQTEVNPYYSAQVANAANTTQAPVYPQNTHYTQQMMQQQQSHSSHHPEITPSPPPQPMINIHGASMAYPPGDVGIGASIGAASCGHMSNLTSSMAYLKPSSVAAEALRLQQGLHQVQQQQQQHAYASSNDAAPDLHHSQHQATTTYHHHHHHQVGLPASQPIAIMGNTHHHQTFSQDNISSSWSRKMMAVERGRDPR